MYHSKYIATNGVKSINSFRALSPFKDIDRKIRDDTSY